MQGMGANPVGTSLKWDLSRVSPRLKIFELLLPFKNMWINFEIVKYVFRIGVWEFMNESQVSRII